MDHETLRKSALILTEKAFSTIIDGDWGRITEFLARGRRLAKVISETVKESTAELASALAAKRGEWSKAVDALEKMDSALAKEMIEHLRSTGIPIIRGPHGSDVTLVTKRSLGLNVAFRLTSDVSGNLLISVSLPASILDTTNSEKLEALVKPLEGMLRDGVLEDAKSAVNSGGELPLYLKWNERCHLLTTVPEEVL